MAVRAGADLYLDQARWLTAEGRLADARELLGRALLEDPEDSYLRTELAAVLLTMGNPGAALTEATAAIALAPQVEWPHRLAAFAWLQLGSPGEALAQADAALGADPSSAHALKARFEAQLALGLPFSAMETARIAREMAPDDIWPRVDQARVALATGRGEEAEALLRSVLDRAAKHSEARQLLALALRAQGKHLEALPELVTSLEVDPESSLARRQLMRAVDRHLGAWPIVSVLVTALLAAHGAEWLGLRGQWAATAVAAAILISAATFLHQRLRCSQISAAVWAHYREERRRTRQLRFGWVLWTVTSLAGTALAVAGLALAAEALHSSQLEKLTAVAAFGGLPAWRAASSWAWSRFALRRLGG